MSLFETYLEAVKEGYLFVQPGDVFKVTRPKTARQKSTVSEMTIIKVTPTDFHYSWKDSEGNETKGKVSKAQFNRDVEAGEIKRIKIEN